MARWRVLLLAWLAFIPFTLAAQARDGMSLEQVAQTRTVTRAAISPTGSDIAYTLSVPRTPGVDDDGRAWSQLHVVDGSGNSRGFITGEASVGAFEWFPDGRHLGLLTRRDGDKGRALYRIPLQGGEASRVAKLERDITAFSLSADGRQAALLSQQPESEALAALRRKGFTQKIYEEDWRPVELWIAQLDAPEAAPRLVEVEGSVQSVHWSPAGDRLALVVTPRQLTDDTLVFARVRIIDLDGRELGRVDNPGKLGALAWSPDGAHLAIISAADENDPREGRLTVVGNAGGAQRDLLPELEGHVWNVAWRDARTLLYVSHEGVETRLGEIGVDGSGDRTVLEAGGPVWGALSVSSSGGIALVGQSPEHPAEVFHLAAGQQQAQRLTDSNPWLADVRLARQEVVRYSARDGLELEGVLVHPLERRGSERVPLILVVHGGPESHYSNGWLTGYAQPAQYAAARGFASFFPNYRASTGRGVAFSKLDRGRPGMEQFDDLVDGVDHLIATGLVDGERVGITGGSYGGYASAWGATYYSERFAASVMFVGISDQASLVTSGDIPYEQHLVHMGKWPWEDPEGFRQASPITHAQKSRTPTLILHGEDDPRVPVGQSYMMYRYLQLAGQAPVRLVLYPGEGHGNARAASRWDYSLRLMRWMEHYLTGPGGEPPPYDIDYRLPAAGES
ncbi:MAG TPA: S9 family peptidase [Candidatus Luteimonas excrementigallinarum]|nr:S9 family peptidase [Candidatus Luteimonas excrementigallinarum]